EGYPPLVVASGYALIPFLAIRTWHHHPPHTNTDDTSETAPSIAQQLKARLPTIAPLATAAILGAGLAAFQLIPFTIRLHQLNLPYRQTPHDSLPPAALLTTAFPWAVGSPSRTTEFTWFGSFAFLGAAAVVLIIVALIAGRPRTLARGIYTYCV